MLAQILNFATLAGLVATPAPPVHYRLDMKFNQTVDPSAMGSPVQVIAAVVTGFVTLTESDTLGGKVAEIRFDSVVVAPGENVPTNLASDASPAKGVIYRSRIVNGRSAGGFKTTQIEPHANLFQSALDAFYPGFRSSAQVGDKWVDTVMTNDSLPVKKESTTMIAWTLSSLSDGVMTLDGVTSGTTTTVQNGANGPMTGKAILKGTRHLTGPVGGSTTGGSLTAAQDLQIYLSNLDPFPGKVDQSVTITRLP